MVGHGQGGEEPLRRSAFLWRLGDAGARLGFPHLLPTSAFLASMAGDETLQEAELQEVSRRLIAAIEQLAQDHGARLTLVLSPEAAELDPQRESAGLRWFRALARRKGYWTVDHAHVLQAGGWQAEQVFVDPWHYSRWGNELLAASILEAPRSEL